MAVKYSAYRHMMMDRLQRGFVVPRLQAVVQPTHLSPCKKHLQSQDIYSIFRFFPVSPQFSLGRFV